MTIESYIIGYLADALDADVSGSVPHPMPDEFVTVEKTGERLTNHICIARLSIKSWSTSRANAAALAALVNAAMLAATAAPEISSVDLDTSYNSPDLDTNKPRYTSTFEVVYLF